MLIAGLTGGIATGKSTVGEMFHAEGAYCIDTDLISRHVVQPGAPGWKQVVEYFGDEILENDGSLDRKKLGSIIFSSPEKRKALEDMLHPKILEEKNRQIEEIRRKDAHALVIVDIPLLIELGRHKSVDAVILVYVPPRIQMNRLMQRDKLSLHDARSRIAAQMPIDEKLRYADYIINNEGPLDATKQAVKEIFLRLKEKEKRSTEA